MKSATMTRLLLAALLCAGWIAGTTIASERSASSMASAADKFLASLSPEQRQQATFAFESEELTRWHYVPAQQFPRNGLPIRAMSEAQRGLAHDLMKTGLSQRGYTQATTIMVDLENILKVLENGAAMRDPEQYRFSIFGTPAAKGVWGWRVNGHHLSLHFNVANGSVVASAPTFFGSNPAEVRVDGPKKGLRVLGDREDSARALLMALDAGQRTTATLEGVAPGDIITKTAVKVDPLAPVGIAASGMTPKQRELLMAVIESYTTSMAPDIASERLAQLQHGRARQDHLRVGRRIRGGQEALLPRAGPDISDRVRQHAERRQSRALGVARLQRRFRAGPAARARAEREALGAWRRSEGISRRESQRSRRRALRRAALACGSRT